MMYKRAKKPSEKANKTKNKSHNLSFHFGKESDGFEILMQECNDKSVDLLKSIEVREGETVDVAFWTDEPFSELICVSHFIKDTNGNISFSLDPSESTF